MSSLRVNIQRQQLVKAREERKRVPENKSFIKNFLESFESQDGKKKYKALLQDAAHDFLETVFIDLNDVETFCKKETMDPKSQMAQNLTLSSGKLSESVEQLLHDIEMNAPRYIRLFFDACCAAIPLPDGTRERTAMGRAKDVLLNWRRDEFRKQGKSLDNFPRLVHDWDVRFKPRASDKPKPLRTIVAEDVGSLVQLQCLVVRIGQVKPQAELLEYKCEVCDGNIFQPVEGDFYTPPKECPSEKCKINKTTGKLRLNMRTSKFGKFQEMRVQELSEHVPVGGVPRGITVRLSGALCRTVLPGDAITLTGVYLPELKPTVISLNQGRRTGQEMYIEAHSVVKHKLGYNEKAEDASKLEEQVDEAHRTGNLYEMGAKSIAPEIFGHADVKKALLLVLIGSVTKEMQDGMKIRGDIHTLLMGDPGVAKSQLMKQVCQIAPRSVYTTGKGASGVGLTATVIRDNKTGEVTLEGGALVLADRGVCCIDEFDKMEESDRTAIHEVMEQQTVSIAKQGITTTLNCRTTIVAAANPSYGRYNPYKSPVENIDLPAALLSRFDLIFLLLDTVEPDKDKMLAAHVCKVHSEYESKAKPAAQKEGMEVGEDLAEGDILQMGFKPYDSILMRAYIRKARTFDPMLDDDLVKDISDAWVSMRDDEKRDGIDGRKSYTTPRTLLGMVRLSQAHARARFSNKVERQDFDEAMRLIKASKESVDLVAPARRGVNPLDLVYEIIADLSRGKQSDEWIDMAHVLGQAGLKALSSDVVMEAIANWESLGTMALSPDKTMVRFNVKDKD